AGSGLLGGGGVGGLGRGGFGGGGLGGGLGGGRGAGGAAAAGQRGGQGQGGQPGQNADSFHKQQSPPKKGRRQAERPRPGTAGFDLLLREHYTIIEPTSRLPVQHFCPGNIARPPGRTQRNPRWICTLTIPCCGRPRCCAVCAMTSWTCCCAVLPPGCAATRRANCCCWPGTRPGRWASCWKARSWR